MQVFDLTRLRDVPSPPATFTEDAHYDGFGNAHNIVINTGSGFAYGVGTSTFNGGPHFVNIQDPLNPVAAGGYGDNNYSHDAQVVTYNGPDTDYTGREILKSLEVVPTAMIDISDGLSSEILHLCKASQVGCQLFEDKIPLDPQVINVCEEFNIDSTTIALSGGEHYELLFTISQDDYPKIKGNPNLTVIGHMTAEGEGKHLITRAATKIPIIARGWNALEEDN